MVVPPVLCVTGRSGSGKTLLLERLIPPLTARGLRVAAIKHCGHIDAAASGKDSDRLARAGADPAIAAGTDALEIGSCRREPLLLDLVTTFCRDRDLVLAEGYSRSVHDKIFLCHPEQPRPPRDDPSVRLVIGGGSGDEGEVGRDDVEAVTRWLLAWLGRRRDMRKALVGAVLVGGQSRRMGADKSALRIAGRRVLGRLCELLADRIGEVMIVGRVPPWRDVPMCAAWHPDARPGLGPLGGIATALRVASASGRASAVFAAACDMPAVEGNLLDHVLGGRDHTAPATVPVNPATGRLEPLFAVYEARALQSIEQALDSGTLAVRDWLSAAGARRLAVPDQLAGQLENVNTPEELEAARLRLEANGT